METVTSKKTHEFGKLLSLSSSTRRPFYEESYLYHFGIHLGGYICFLSALDDASCKQIPEIISKLAEIRSEVTNITETVYKVKIAFAQLASRYLFFAAGEKC